MKRQNQPSAKDTPQASIETYEGLTNRITELYPELSPRHQEIARYLKMLPSYSPSPSGRGLGDNIYWKSPKDGTLRG